MKKPKQYATRIQASTLSLVLIIALIYLSSSTNQWAFKLDWTIFVIIGLLCLLFINFVYLNHYTHSGYGEGASEEFFYFPLNIISALSTIAFFYQIAFEMQDASTEHSETVRSKLANFSNEVVVDSWEASAMAQPDLNRIYKKIFGNISGNNGEMMSRAQWEKSYPHISYVPFDGNETQWHYAAKFCQEMIDVIRIFDLIDHFKIKNSTDREKSLSGDDFSGWMTTFRMFLRDPTVRNVWEQYKYRHANPYTTAWVQYFITDVIDQDTKFMAEHKASWQRQVNQYLKREKST